MARHPMVVSPRWAQVAIVTFLAGFTVLIYLAVKIGREHPPVPARVVTPAGETLFTEAEVLKGQHLFQKYGLMQFGTLFGHGAYLGPDFTAQYIEAAGTAMVEFLRDDRPLPVVEAEVRAQFKANRYDPQSGVLTYTPAQAHAFAHMNEFYRDWFGAPAEQEGLRRPHIAAAEETQALTAYFSWAAWAATAQRPGTSYSYTNNWPPAPRAGNQPTADALVWSVLSLIALLGGVGIIFYIFGRYDILGWHRLEDQMFGRSVAFRTPEEVKLTPGQRATAWYFLVVGGLFLMQGLLGGANAHYHVEPAGFYGIDIAGWLPYNLTRMWHLQLAIFFVASAYLAMGIFLAPMIAGSEPKHQDKLALALFGALVVVVVGSLLGEGASLHNAIGLEGPWWSLGAQGWEYIDLGRVWQALLTVGLGLWVFILVRGLAPRLRVEHPGNMPWLFVYSAAAIPLFYAAGMVIGKNVNFAVADYWRFWVVHLWVEDFLELFTTVMVAYVFVLLRVVRVTTATRVIYLDVILYSIGGVIGTMHHLYFSGAPALHMALGAFFSAMEVVPLVLLTYEAWRFMRLGSPQPRGSVFDVSSAAFPHKYAVLFLVAVGFWNFLGAGVFGFLINLPIVSYYEIGTQFTANHGHGAMMGVYGMLAVGFFLFVARYFVPRDRGSERAMKLCFWSLNVGLAWMLFANLAPIGVIQLYEAVEHGYAQARDAAFFEGPWVTRFEWLRLPGDVLFIVGGILPLVYLAVRIFKNRRRVGAVEPEAEADEFVTAPA